MNKKSQRPLLIGLGLVVAFICGFALAWVLRMPDAQPSVDPVPEPGIVQPADPEAEPEPDPDPGAVPAPEPEPEPSPEPEPGPSSSTEIVVDGKEAYDPVTDVTVHRDGTYTSKDEVALYIHVFGDVPSNYITKTKARKAGWVAEEGNLWDVLPGMSIGGGGFQNIEGEVPVPYDPDRTWKECDIDYEGGYRGPYRLVYSDDGYILYTGDHYDTFEQLFPREGA